MPDNILGSIYGTADTAMNINFWSFLISIFASIVFGIAVALLYMHKNKFNRQFVVTLALLPAVTQIVITLVNGNLGTGIAVMGAFSLVRFRSLPGNARDIGSIFLAMAMGLATGMGYIGAAVVFLIIYVPVSIILNSSNFGVQKNAGKYLKITIPENLDYSGLFDDLFDAFTEKSELISVKTANMGTVYKLQYEIFMKDSEKEKEFIDELRCRNANMEIHISKISTDKTEL